MTRKTIRQLLSELQGQVVRKWIRLFRVNRLKSNQVMPKLFQRKRVHGVSDDAVKAKTGKKWDEWFKVLDKAGARMMDHTEIAQLAQKQIRPYPLVEPTSDRGL